MQNIYPQKIDELANTIAPVVTDYKASFQNEALATQRPRYIYENPRQPDHIFPLVPSPQGPVKRNPGHWNFYPLIRSPA